MLAGFCEIADIDRAIRLKWLIVYHLDVELLTVAIRQQAQLYDAPFLAVNKLALMFVIDKLRDDTLLSLMP